MVGLDAKRGKEYCGAIRGAGIMSGKHLKRKPHDIENGWWYEENWGISVCVPDKDGRVTIAPIRWQAIRNALKRKDKK